ncbi:GNAT family N-acetyltransferase [uncultured Psychrobacter sp.]|uniref:GNAT family N-acetyltransferase n=1 Tax=uncultured Psychrobacter sp. TaxID=259303 RepID=UPI00345A9B4A
MYLNQDKVFSTSKADVFFMSFDMAKPLQEYLLNNKERLIPFEPSRSSEYYELDSIHQRIITAIDDQTQKTALSLIITVKNSNRIIGIINFTGLTFGVFQACCLGFSIDKDFEGQGIMHITLQRAISHMREQYGLHRIMANHLPNNVKSEQLLAKLGFVREGYAKSYLKINGEWQDHILNALVFGN